MTRALRLIRLIGACCVLVPAVAWAKPRIALAPLDNDPSGDVQDAVTAALGGGELVVLSPKQVGRAVERLGLEGELSEKDAKKLANELDADAVVVETLSAKGGTKTLHFKLFVHGKKQKGFKIEFASAKSKKFRAALHDKMVSKLGDAGGDDDTADAKPTKKKKQVAAADDDSDSDATTSKPGKKKKAAAASDDDADAGDPPSKPSKKKKAAAADDSDADPPAKPGKKKKAAASDDDNGGDADAKPAKKKGVEVSANVDVDADADAKPAKKSADVDADAGGDASADDKPVKKKKKVAAADDDDGGSTSVHARVEVGGSSAGRDPNRAALRVEAGGSATGRSLSWTARTTTEGYGDPKKYTNAPVPGARVDGEFYPLGLMGNGWVSGFGVAGFYDKTFALNVQTTAQPGTKFPVEEYHWELGLRYRLVFGPTAMAPSLTVGVDYGHQQFKINRAGLMPNVGIDEPDVEYVGFTPDVQFRLPLVRQFSLLFMGGSLLALRAGEITAPEQYGKGKLTAADASAGFDIIITRNIAVRVLGEFAQYGVAFNGTGASIDRGGTSPVVGGAQDRYYGGSLTVAGMY